MVDTADGERGAPAGSVDDTGAWQIGDRIRDWRLTRFLGRGTFADVYEAEWASTLEPTRDMPYSVALKLMSIPRAHDRLRVIEEARAGIDLRHGNLLATLDVFDEYGTAVLVLERADGSLSDRLVRNGGRLNTEEGWTVMSDIARGLAFWHSNGRVHSDVKPENMLVVGNRWKLADFGISARIEDGMTHGYGPTNLAYTPPEAVRADHGPRGPKVRQSYDVWAYGLAMHIAVAGYDPRPGSDAIQRVLASADGRLVIDPLLDPLAFRVLNRCLAPEANRATAQEIVDLLGAGPPASVPVVPLPHEEPAPPRRRRLAMLIAVPAVAGAVAIGAYAVTELDGKASPDVAVSAIVTTTAPPPTTTSTTTAVVTTSPPPPALAALSAPATTLAVEVGQTAPLNLTGTMSDGGAAPSSVLQTASWTSDNPGVATVTTDPSGTTLAAVAPGTATLTANDNGVTLTVLVTVSPPADQANAVPTTAPKDKTTRSTVSRSSATTAAPVADTSPGPAPTSPPSTSPATVAPSTTPATVHLPATTTSTTTIRPP
jgi:serine/threonine protein kinase